jgi:hypothetical protein
MAWSGKLVGAAVTLALIGGSVRANALDDATKASLAEHLRAGSVASKAKQWNACIQAYTAAAAIEGAPATWGELGLCEEQAGRFLDAYNHLRRAVDATPPELPPEKAAQWKRFDAAQVRLRKRLVILFVTVTPTRAAVILDGRPVGRVDGRHIAVEPGTHTVAARLEGYHDAVEPPRTWSAGDIPRVHLELTPKPPGLPAATESPLPAAKASTLPAAKASGGASSPSAPRGSEVTAPLPWYMPAPTPRGVLVPAAMVGLGALAISGVTALALEVDRGSLQKQVGSDSACASATGQAQPACQALDERFHQRNTAVDVTIGALIATAVLGGAGGLALGLERRSRGPAVVPAAGQHGGGIFVRGAW